MSRQFRFLVLSGLALLVACGALLLVESRLARRPPPLPVIAETRPFVVTNQAGVRLDSQSLRGHPCVIDLIFTRCPGPCRQLTGVMRRIQDRLPHESGTKLLSVTSDPEFDTPGVLAGYAAKFGADTNRWQFVTASRPEIHDLAVRQLKLVLVEKDAADRSGPDDLFLHSTMIVVLDGQGRLRAAVEALEPGADERVLGLVRQLEAER